MKVLRFQAFRRCTVTRPSSVLMISTASFLFVYIVLYQLPQTKKFPDVTFANARRPVYEKRQVAKQAQPKPEMKVILHWTTVWANPHYLGEGQGPFLQNGCQVNACVLTSNKTWYNKSDALIIHLRNIKTPAELPPYRHPAQMYIFLLMEPPVHVKGRLPNFPGHFNVSWTYRLDSNFSRPYGKTVPLTQDERNAVLKSWPKDFSKGKLKMVFWAVSDCDAPSGRDWVGHQLQKYISVDIYGKCGNLTYPRNPYATKHMHEIYKFNLAFENSICKDYITEKTWRTLTMGVVPVVLGGGDYKSRLPPNSYIDVRNFTSIKALADYLTLLDNDNRLYNQYFQWRKEYGILSKRDTVQTPLCQLCASLHDKTRQQIVIEDLEAWFGETNTCMRNDIYYQNISDSPWFHTRKHRS